MSDQTDILGNGDGVQGLDPSTVLPFDEAARLVGVNVGALHRAARLQTIDWVQTDSGRVVTVAELIRTKRLDPSGSPWIDPPLELVGLPLDDPVNAARVLTLADAAGLTGVSLTRLVLLMQRGDLKWSMGRARLDARKRVVLVAVSELIRLEMLDAAGKVVYISPRRGWRQGRRVRGPALLKDLPTELDDPRIGIQDPELARLVLVTLSRVLGADRSRDAMSMYKLCRLLRCYAHTDLTRAGEKLPPPCPDVDPELGIPVGSTVVRHLGEPGDQRLERWKGLKDQDELAAAFDVNYLAHYVPPPLWRVVAAVIVDGPTIANQRLTRVAYAETQRNPELLWSGRDASAKVSTVTIKNQLTVFRRLYRAGLHWLKKAKYPSKYLEEWTFVPDPIEIDDSEWVADRSAPSRSQLRLVWQRSTGEIHQKLNSGGYGDASAVDLAGFDDVDAIARVRSMSPQRVRGLGLFRLCRNRALYAVFATLGGRKEATMALGRSDYMKRFRDPDGELSAAIRTRPGKTVGAKRVSWKPIPIGLELVIDLYLAVTEVLIGHPLPEDGPLFVRSPSHFFEGFTGHGVANVFGGTATVVPMMPKPEESRDWSGSMSPARSGGGYSPQSFRRAALQLTRAGARQYCRENDLEIDPEILSEVLLDHVVSSDRLGYADVKTIEGRVRWTKVATQVTWEMLTTDRGARRMPDVERFRELLRVQQATEHERDRTNEDLERLLEARFDSVSKELIVEISVAVHRYQQLQHRLNEITATLLSLEHDKSTWRVLPDDEEPVKVDLRAVRRGESGESRTAPPKRLREFLTVTELGEFAGSAPTARRWLQGKLPFKDGDPRNPWSPGDEVVDDALGPRKRRVAIARINESLFDTPGKRARRDQLLGQLPVGFTHQECALPLFAADTSHQAGERR